MGAFIDNEVPEERGAYSHAAGYEACERTEMIACSDLREDVMEQVGERYGVARDKQYTDYKEMIDREQPEIVSVATQPEHRAEIVIYAVEHGARAIYAEKALAASMNDAKAMLEAVERNNVFLNMGTNRRWDVGYDTMKGVIDSGRIGSLKTVISHMTGTMFNTASHIFDLLVRLNGDSPVAWVQAHLANGDDVIQGDRLTEDPSGMGTLCCENGVMLHAMNSGRGLEVEAVGDQGVVTSIQDGKEWRVREPGGEDYRGRKILASGTFPDYQHVSSTQRLIEDLVHSLDTGEAPRGGIRKAYANNELIFAFIESHVKGGARVELPLEDSSYRLERARGPQQPRFER
jgi:predicted dehydrogenase